MFRYELLLTSESLKSSLVKKINATSVLKSDGNQGKLWNDMMDDEAMRILGKIIKTANRAQKLEIDCSG